MTFKELRQSRGLSQKQLAQLMGVEQSRVSYIENGRIDTGNLTLINAVKLSQILGITAEELLNLNNPR